MQTQPQHIDAKLESIARRYLLIETLETQGSDALDFKDVAVWSIKAALQAAFEAGQQVSGKAVYGKR